MEKKLKFKLNKKIGVFIILAIILIASIIGVLFYNKFEFNIVGNEREGAKAAGDELVEEWRKENSNVIAIAQMNDGGFAILTGGGKVYKYNNSGTLEWDDTIYYQRNVFGDMRNESLQLTSVTATKDGGCVVVGYGISREMTQDYEWVGKIIKYNNNGNKEWENVIGDGITNVCAELMLQSVTEKSI